MKYRWVYCEVCGYSEDATEQASKFECLCCRPSAYSKRFVEMTEEEYKKYQHVLRALGVRTFARSVRRFSGDLGPLGTEQISLWEKEVGFSDE